MIAVSETQKYLNAGYNAFIEQTLLEGEAYYRVRVGGFKSLDEVEKFLNY
jgi:cell division septation protein DedD